MTGREDLIKELSSYLASRTDIAFAFLFGSMGKGRFHPNSDVAVYYSTKDLTWFSRPNGRIDITIPQVAEHIGP